MYVDYLTLACSRDRLDALLGARVQRVVLPDTLSVGIELYAGQRFQMLISAHPQYARMLLVPEKPRRGVDTETPLLQLMRKWVRGARLVNVTQPPWERILMLHFKGQAGECRLVVELIGRYSNTVLVGPDGCVLAATKYIGPDLNRYRVTLPAHPYQLPPVPPGRQPPTDVTESEWASHVGGAGICRPDEPLHRLLTGRLLGVSPMVAREIAARAMGDPQAKVCDLAPKAVTAAIAELFAPIHGNTAWSPHVALDKDNRVIAFAPYEPHQFERIEPVAHISEAMWRYFEQQLAVDPYAAARQHVQNLVDTAGARVERTLAQLESQVIDEAEINTLREAGELLLAYQGQVKRRAQEVTVPDHTGEPCIILLNPTLTPVENAQGYFHRYRKATRAAKEVDARIAAITPDLAYAKQLAADLALAESRPEIDSVHNALVAAGWAQKAHRAGGSSDQVSGPRRFEVDGFTIYVGRNARQNEQVTFKRAGPDDLWLHVRGHPGAHVIIKSGGRNVPEHVIQRAAELAAHYSPARGERQVNVDVTKRRFVRRVRGGHPGLVTCRNERTVRVAGTTETNHS
ncbi:MAG: fibronectin/fibrinogen-binding protein [Chloroflexi bacterium]|nr:fibronectin/fibrinogen-binding protein [Chloroflexota bacterium]